MTALTKPAPLPFALPTSFRSLVIDRGRLEVRLREIGPVQAREVLIRVGAVGLCRTDLAVMSGTIPVASPLVPGHEFGGTIAITGGSVAELQAGDRVTVNPVLYCGACKYCTSGMTQYCRSTRFLGLDIDGACSEFVIVPATAVHAVPQGLPPTVSAFAEPVAASLGVLNSGISPAETGVIVGENRIGRLTERVLRAQGFDRIEVCPAAAADSLADDVFDYAIETEPAPEVLCTCCVSSARGVD